MADSRPCRELPSFATGVAPEHHIVSWRNRPPHDPATELAELSVE
jgi:hypothetical protein